MTQASDSFINDSQQQSKRQDFEELATRLLAALERSDAAADKAAADKAAADKAAADKAAADKAAADKAAADKAAADKAAADKEAAAVADAIAKPDAIREAIPTLIATVAAGLIGAAAEKNSVLRFAGTVPGAIDLIAKIRDKRDAKELAVPFLTTAVGAAGPMLIK